jgi:NADPH-dependent curcumin reductase CurA
MTVGWIAGRLTNRRMGILAVREGPAQLEDLAELCIAVKIAIHIDRTYGLDEVPDALAHVGHGHALGKVVVTIDMVDPDQ